VNASTVTALTDFFPHLWPEALLGIAACVLFLGGTWRSNRHLWGAASLVALALAGLLLLKWPVRHFPIDESLKTEEALKKALEAANASLYAGPLIFDHLALLIRALALAGGAVLILVSWDDVPDDQAADYHACILIMVAGIGFTAMANELVTLFLAGELVSIPTYILLYLPRVDRPAQEAAMKYFLLSVFSSALLLFGFSYLYGLAGTTNLPALARALGDARGQGVLPGVALVALVMVVAGLGFRISAVPFHFYAPDVYQGTTTPAAALLAFVPKVAGFVALVRVLGFVLPNLVQVPSLPEAARVLTPESIFSSEQPLGDQMPVLLWIVAAVTMSLGNLLALLQDNVKRLLAYSSVAHAGYMLIGLAVAPKLTAASAPVGGVEAVLFYLVAYGGMTVGAFAILACLSTPERPAETVDDLAGLARSHPGMALLMVLFLFSLIGIPFTAGFYGKLWIFLGALGVPYDPAKPAEVEQYRLFVWLAVIGAINAAIGAWYYLRIATVMYLREPLHPLPKPRAVPLRVAVLVCAVVTLGIGIYPTPLVRAVQAAVPPRNGVNTSTER
jgi:NADH-quinone oxidoreductase subunit N